MDDFPRRIKQAVLDITQTLITSDPGSRMIDHVTVARGYSELFALRPRNAAYVQKLRQALADLLSFAQQQGQSLLAARLERIAHHLGRTRFRVSVPSRSTRLIITEFGPSYTAS